MNKRIVIIGAGYSGILIAKKLAKRIKKNKIRDLSVTLIDKNPFHTMLTELHEIAAGRVEEDSIRISLKKVFARRRVDVRLDTVRGVDTGSHTVEGTVGQYPYDYLVLAAGSRPTYFGVEGAREHSYTLWSYDDAVNLREHIEDMFRRAMRETDGEEKKRLLHFDIVGAGFTGVEMAGELAEYIPILCGRYEIDRRWVTLRLIDVLERTVPCLPEDLSRKAERRLRRMGVDLWLGTKVLAVGPDFIKTGKGEDQTLQKTATVIWAAGIESAAITGSIARTQESASRGRIQVDPYLRSLKDESLYVAGDNMFYVAPGDDVPVPQVVENCENCAGVIAHNILCAATGKGEMETYKPDFHGIMVSIGGRYGIARVGLPSHMFRLPSFLAMFAKHFINVVYFVQVLGWNKIFSYLKHEFFTIRNRRSFVGGHLSNRTPSFLLVPLRLWLGAVWLFEGIVKVVEGWLRQPRLTEFIGQASGWYNAILLGEADSVTKATGTTGEATVSAGVKLFDFGIPGLFRAIFVSGKELSKAAISDYAFKLDIPLMNKIMEAFVFPRDGLQIAMQSFIVIAEILIGLALLGGLFTAPASAFSLVLQGMFVCTTGLYLSTFWMIFAAIATLIGAGRIFGLDYYAMPWLKTWWQGVPFARRTYLYHD